ncbi:MAG: hypothetical protein Q9180_006252, partial [Flavoplaca navasiana]
ELESIEVLIKGFVELSRKSKTNTHGTATSSMRQLTDLERHSSPLARSLEEVEKLTCKLERVGCSKGSKWRAITQALDWPFSQKEVLSSLERLERMRTMLVAGLGIDHLGVSLLSFEKNLSLDTHEGINTISEHLSNIEQTDFLDGIYQWLAAPDALQSYEEARKKRLPTTGDWFMKSPEYGRWKTETNSLLWLHGMTGCGKTVLSSTIIEDLNEHCRAHDGHTLIYFYFESNGTFEQHSTSFLRSLLLQLSRHNEAGMLKLRQLYFDCDKGRKQPTRDALYITLRTLFQSFAASYILLDALDECKDRSKPLHLIQTIHDWQLDNVHSLVTSRREADIKEILEPIARADQIVELAPSLINDDISKYIQHSLSIDRNLSRWRRKLDIQEKIRENLFDKGDGLYETRVVPPVENH